MTLLRLNRQLASAFDFTYTNADTPSVSGYGTSVTPTASDAAATTWTQIASAANIASDVYWVTIRVTGGTTAGAAKNHLIDIGIDPAGGTNYGVVVDRFPVGQSATLTSYGMEFSFPWFIPAGATMAARVQGSNATAGTVRVHVFLNGVPTNPGVVLRGSQSEVLGTVTGSLGVSFTPGNSGAEGTWVSLGSTTKRLFWWQIGVQQDNNTVTNLPYHIDVSYGAAGGDNMLLRNIIFMQTGTSEIAWLTNSMQFQRCYRDLPSGTQFWVRGTCSGTAETGFNARLLGVG